MLSGKTTITYQPFWDHIENYFHFRFIPKLIFIVRAIFLCMNSSFSNFLLLSCPVIKWKKIHVFFFCSICILSWDQKIQTSYESVVGCMHQIEVLVGFLDNKRIRLWWRAKYLIAESVHLPSTISHTSWDVRVFVELIIYSLRGA